MIRGREGDLAKALPGYEPITCAGIEIMRFMGKKVFEVLRWIDNEDVLDQIVRTDHRLMGGWVEQDQ